MEIGNGVTFIGRLTRDIEIKTAGETSVTNFSLARNRWKKDKSAEDIADFIECTAFGKNAEFVSKYFKKGERVGVYGKLQTKTWEKDGQKHISTYILVDGFEFIENANGTYKNNVPEENAVEKKNTKSEPIDDSVSDDDLPF